MSHFATWFIIFIISSDRVWKSWQVVLRGGCFVYQWDMTRENGWVESRIKKEDQAAFEKDMVTLKVLCCVQSSFRALPLG
jgi:hypothetical protein